MGPRDIRPPAGAGKHARITELETWQESQGAGPGERGQALVPRLTIVYHPQIERIGEAVALRELSIGQPVLVSRATPSFSASDPGAAAPLADRNLSRNPIRITAAPGGAVRIEIGDCPTRVSVAGRPLEGAVEVEAAALSRGVPIELGGRVVLLLHEAPDRGATNVPPSADAAAVRAEILGESAPMQKLRSDIRRVADLDVPVLIRGESGSGKELVARALHRAGARRDGPFVAVNLGAIPQALAVSELFGASRGAFTGAVQKQAGHFVQARGGTLFLDEVGEASPEVQVALLRALETGEIQAVGAQRPEKVDVRVVAATDADLEAKIEGGDFRAPLLYRLSAYELWVPPLRDRKDDLGRLLVTFLAEELARAGEKDHLASPPERGELWLPASVVARLVAYDWPGNVRQLRNVVRQIVIGNRGRPRVEVGPELERLLQRRATSGQRPQAPQGPTPSWPPPSTQSVSDSGPVLLDSPSPPAAGLRPSVPPPDGSAPSDRRKPSEVSPDEIESALRACRWDLSAAAAMLRIPRPSLYMLMEQSPRFRTSSGLSEEEIARAYEECGGDIARMVDRLHISEKALRRKLRALGM